MAEPPIANALYLRERTSERPLRVLLTRPDEQIEETAGEVRLAGGEPLCHPCLRRALPPDSRALEDALRDLDRYDVVAVTSANAALALGEALRAQNSRLPLTATRPFFAAIGPRTAAALAAQALTPELVADEESTAAGLARAIAEALSARGRKLDGTRVLFPRALEAHPTLPATLRQQGATVVEVVAYQMVAASAESLSALVGSLYAGIVDLAPFGSPRTAKIALDAIGKDAGALFAKVRVGAIGGTTAAALIAAGVRVDAVAKPATFSALLQALATLW